MPIVILLFILGFIAGSLIVWLYREVKVKSGQRAVVQLREQIQQKDAELDALHAALNAEQQARVKAETRFEEIKNTFKALAAEALKDNNQVFLDLARGVLENLLTDAKGDLQKRQQEITNLVRPLKDLLEKYEAQIREIERSRIEAYGGLKQLVEQQVRTHQQLLKETARLATALKRPEVRGRWGELTLRRVVEVAGMSQFCDFSEQVPVDTEEGRKQPDLIVHLPNARVVVVDAKVPLSAYMSAIEAEDDNSRKDFLAQYAQAVREHIKFLGSKKYWNQFSASPDFVVLFLPGESFFSAALGQDRNLIEEGITNRVILATPTTLIALLRAVAYSWQQQQLAENARRIAEAGTDLFERVCKFAEHLNGIRNGLDGAVDAYNAAIGSWEHRVIPVARKLKELGAASPDQQLVDIEPVEKSLRQIPDLSEEK